MKIAYQASHEQFAPSELLRYAELAERAGFDALNSSDHFAPWKTAGHSGFAWSWLGAALERTRLPAGVVCAPGQRYHPAIIAQAAATLAEMYPGRLTLALGSGEAVNESITGQGWPDKATRNRRLLECADIIRRLWRGETVTHRGLVTVEAARLYTLPATPPVILCAALSEETARWAGSWADGLITTARPLEELQKLVGAFRDHGGRGKPVHLKVDLSYAADEHAALAGAMDQWRLAGLEKQEITDLPQPEHLEAATRDVTPEELKQAVQISADLDEHAARLQAYAGLDLEAMVLHNVNLAQRPFIKAFGTSVLPALRKAAR